LDQHVRERKETALNARGDSDVKDLFDDLCVKTKLFRSKTNTGIGAHHKDEDHDCRKILRNDRRDRNSLDAHTEYRHEKEIENHVDHTRDRQEDQGVLGISHRAHHRGAVVIKHRRGNAAKNNSQIQRRTREYRIGGIHQNEQLRCENKTNHRYDHAENDRKQDRVMYDFFDAFVIVRTDRMRYKNTCTDRKPHKKTDDQIGQRTRTANGGKREFSAKASDDYKVCRIIKGL